jgi:hypothetical protein
MAGHGDLTRRELVQIGTAAAVTAAGAVTGLAAEPAPKFFSKDEFAMADELAELIIPADDHSPGARAAQVAAYIDARLAEAFEDRPREIWREGLRRIDALSKEMHGRLFMEAAPEQRIELLTRISRNEEHPQTPEEHFFRELKFRTAYAYYTSKIGIHQDMEYKGNILLPEFVGYDAK